MQEWATFNNIALPHREGARLQAAQLYKWEEERANNILQVRFVCLQSYCLSALLLSKPMWQNELCQANSKSSPRFTVPLCNSASKKQLSYFSCLAVHIWLIAAVVMLACFAAMLYCISTKPT